MSSQTTKNKKIEIQFENRKENASMKLILQDKANRAISYPTNPKHGKIL